MAPPRKTMLVVGASGVVGRAAIERFSGLDEWDVVGVSRRTPHGIDGATLLSLDLLDPEQCAAAFGAMAGVTHVIYAALSEAPGLVSGWRDRAQMQRNLTMLRNVLDPLCRAARSLEHVSLLQGTKAYGVHLEITPIPARERWPRHPHENFYFLQEDYLRAAQRDAGFTLTIWRPQVVYGESFGSPMNLIPALGAYAAVSRERGEPLSFPGGATGLTEAVDADLLAAAFEWATDAPAARDETFNITNGDVFSWRDSWPAIAESLGMEVGPDRPLSLAVEMPRRADEWAAIVDRHALQSPRALDAFVGDSFVYADMLFHYGSNAERPPALVSTIKLRQAGFGDCIDTEDMFRKWFGRFRERRLLPPLD
ncbi:MAG TPA: NAD-dependent epimerase/dehydratase family protein [Acidimicrobiales bacterium]|nr:NAD-dependent epimerase/dehydratase family protein [Acidimicrobiales bacterium]